MLYLLLGSLNEFCQHILKSIFCIQARDTLHLLTVYFALIVCVVFESSSLKKFYVSA